jgi:hypothetical protein
LRAEFRNIPAARDQSFMPVVEARDLISQKFALNFLRAAEKGAGE